MLQTNRFWTLSPVHQGRLENLLGSWSSGTGQSERGSEETQKHTHTLTRSISHTFLPLMNNQDLLRPHQRTVQQMGRPLCEVITDNLRYGGGEEKRGWCVKKETPENTIRSWVKTKKKKKEKKNQCSIFLLYLVSFSLHGPSPRGKAGKVGCSEKESGRGQEKEMTHILKNSDHLTSQNTPDTMTEPIWATLPPK